MAIAEREILSRPRYDGLPMSEQEIMSLPDDGYKYELVDGRAKLVPANYRHGPIIIRLLALFIRWGLDRTGRFTESSTGYRMRTGNIRVPDIAFTRIERAPTGEDPAEFLDRSPDLVVEVISPSENQMDMARKVAEYLEAGTLQVWQIFPETRRVIVYHSLDDIQTFRDDEILRGGDLLDGFECPVGSLFSDGGAI